MTLHIHLHALDDDASACSGHQDPPTRSLHSASPSGAVPRNPVQPIFSSRVPVPGNNATLVWQHSTGDLLQQRPGCSRTSCYVHVRVLPADSSRQPQGGLSPNTSDTMTPSAASKAWTRWGPLAPAWRHGSSRRHAASTGAVEQAAGEVALAEGTFFLAPFKDMQLPDPQLRVTPLAPVHKGAQTSHPGSTGGPQAHWQVKVSSSRPAVYATWGLPEGVPGLLDSASWFSNNAVVVHPCHPRHVTLYVTHGSSLAHHLQRQHKHIKLQATSLYDHQDDSRWQGTAAAPLGGGSSGRRQQLPLHPDVLEL